MCAGCPPQEVLDRLKAQQAKAPVNIFDTKAMRARLPDPRLRAEVYHDIQRYGKLTARVQAILDNPPPIPARWLTVTSAGVTRDFVAQLRHDPRLIVTPGPPLFDDFLGEVDTWKIEFLDQNDAEYMDHRELVLGAASMNRPARAQQIENQKRQRHELRRSVSRVPRWAQSRR